jgi:ATPase subunit of ABC transporter with duplicated ATPase domains
MFLVPFIKGSKTFGTNVSVGYYDQEQANLHGNKTVLAELWDEHPTTPEKEKGMRSIIDFKRVDLPIPFGPTKAMASLRRISK